MEILGGNWPPSCCLLGRGSNLGGQIFHDLQILQVQGSFLGAAVSLLDDNVRSVESQRRKRLVEVMQITVLNLRPGNGQAKLTLYESLISTTGRR